MTFDRIVVICMSELNIYDLNYIEMMTLREFNYRMYALEYERLKEDMNMYKLAFAIRDAQAEEKKPGGKKGEAQYRLGALTTSSIMKLILSVLIVVNKLNMVVNHKKKKANLHMTYYNKLLT